MINKKYTLKDAFEIGILKHGELVSINSLYFPMKNTIKKINGIFHTFSINRTLNVDLWHIPVLIDSDNRIFVQFTEERYIQKEIAESIASDLLTYEPYLSATVKLLKHSGRYCFKIEISPEVIVYFKGKEEFPCLELPPQTAYVFG